MTIILVLYRVRRCRSPFGPLLLMKCCAIVGLSIVGNWTVFDFVVLLPAGFGSRPSFSKGLRNCAVWLCRVDMLLSICSFEVLCFVAQTSCSTLGLETYWGIFHC